MTEDAKTTERTDENGKVACACWQGCVHSIQKSSGSAKTGGTKVDGTEAFTEDTKLYAHWLVSHDLERRLQQPQTTTDADKISEIYRAARNRVSYVTATQSMRLKSKHWFQRSLITSGLELMLSDEGVQNLS